MWLISGDDANAAVYLERSTDPSLGPPKYGSGVSEPVWDNFKISSRGASQIVPASAGRDQMIKLDDAAMRSVNIQNRRVDARHKARSAQPAGVK